QAKPGTRAWEARLEIEKLGRIITERVAVYEAADGALKEQLRHELDSLEAQFLIHASEVDLLNVGGRGYVAVEGKLTGAQVAEQRGYPKADPGYHWVYKSGELEYRSSDTDQYPKLKYDPETKKFSPDTGAYQEPSFPANTPREQAFRDLGAYDPRSEFKQFLDLLVQEGLIKTPEELIPAMIEPGGLQYRRVRHKLKEPFVAALLDRATNPTRLETLPAYAEALKSNPDKTRALRAAAAEELIRISDGLPVKDRGNFGEAWYARLFPSTDPAKPYKQVEVTPDQLNPQLAAGQEQLKDVRRLDELRGNTIYEIKNWTYPLNGDHQAELHDQAKILGHQIQATEKAATPGAKPVTRSVKVDALVVVFLTPEGSAANARFAEGFLKAYPDLSITIEFHNGRGEVARVDNKKRAWLSAKPGGLADWLAGTGAPP
ncbi:MAG TPA: hypothetical protein VHU81_17700, partial [Thermoanaerobaculia bacterium]|nr:hypothetical protein [Thermoanaerobaculia bacterium]